MWNENKRAGRGNKTRKAKSRPLPADKGKTGIVHNGDSVHLARLHRGPIRARQSEHAKRRRVKWRKLFQKFYMRQQPSSTSPDISPPISLVERRQRNEQFFFPRPINIFATILLLRSPSPPALVRGLPLLSFLFQVSFPPTAIWVIPSRRCVMMGDRCPLLNIRTFPSSTTKTHCVLLRTLRRGRKITADEKEKWIARRIVRRN